MFFSHTSLMTFNNLVPNFSTLNYKNQVMFNLPESLQNSANRFNRDDLTEDSLMNLLKAIYNHVNPARNKIIYITDFQINHYNPHESVRCQPYKSFEHVVSVGYVELSNQQDKVDAHRYKAEYLTYDFKARSFIDDDVLLCRLESF